MMSSENQQIMRMSDSIVLRSQPVVRKTQAELIKEAKLCDSLPSLKLQKRKRAHPRSEHDKFYYNLEGLSKVWSLAQICEIHMRLGQFLEAERQPDYSKRI